MADNGFHYSSLAIKKEFKPALDDLLRKLNAKSLAALITAIAANPEESFVALSPIVEKQREADGAARLANVRAQMAAK